MATLVISYARPDQPLVRGVVKLLRAALPEIDDAVFWDEDFEAGEAWFEQFTRSIDAAPKLFVFWCWHSARSAPVTREWEYALSAGKVVVPVLLDKTRLSGALAPIHGVDLREAIRHPALRLSEDMFHREIENDFWVTEEEVKHNVIVEQFRSHLRG